MAPHSRPTETDLLTQALGGLGGFGARWAARLLPTITADHSFRVDAPEAAARERLAGVLADRTVAPYHDCPAGALCAMVGSGHAGLNPAVLTITTQPDGTGTLVRVRAAAKEGLVKQATAATAARWLEASLREALSPPAAP